MMLRKLLFSRVFFILLLISITLTTPFKANESPISNNKNEKLDSYIQKTVNKLVIPGLSIAISYEGELVYSQVFGEDINKQTQFYIGSTTKPFTSLAIMQLMERGQIKLDEKVSTYLPAFTVSEKITVRHLLQHTSGMSESEYISKLPPYAHFSDLIEDMNQLELSNEPGDAFFYFNPNYSLLGAIIESVSGYTYPDYIKEHIIDTLQLNHTSLSGEVDTPGHVSFFGIPIKRTEPFKNYDLPAGYITSTAEDIVTFLDAFAYGKTELGISQESVSQMMTGNSANYGMGWIVSNVGGTQAVHHGGSLPGYSSEAIILNEEGYNISYLINKNHLINGMVFYPDLTDGIISILMDRDPVSKANYYWIVRVLLVLFVATLLYNVYNAAKMIKQRNDITMKQRIKGSILNTTIPLTVILLIPILSPYILGRGMTWELAFLVSPDLIAWLFLGVGVHLVEAAIHIGFIIKEISSDKDSKCHEVTIS
ncbi:serine hydrolase [Evansella sp. AB-P1]|uniref:serine hydrolase domain-containing protein n=1 Tax=Evansella sp. AB-P1 TaxID=3037653 RepID=UPI00241F9BDD|nr:serine hydrolase domain-containing protein [Evansella sp. AB-P1]MDG5789799.1 serine hydrolase [Evansella sp. AB-P1]